MIKRKISPNVVTYSALVDAFVKNGKVLEAKELYEEMMRMCIDPDVVTYSSLINGLCVQGRIDEASEMFDLMVRRGCFPDVVSYNTLINGFCKSKRVEDGMRLFREMSQRGLVSSTVTYNTLIQGKGLHCEIDALYTKMKGDGLMLNDGTLCIRDGDITVSAELIKEMLSRGNAPFWGCKKAVSLL
ncbi:BnaA09g10580D [Brassica napus]|uniref:BnaA09g10580D protein n=1 Tax=Brassica napus TaxID=3708 RepID=A0A078HQ93_BRANA|nr:BnaA09g10580D [Brassica napus]